MAEWSCKMNGRMRIAVAVCAFLALVGPALAKSTPRLRETEWRPTAVSDGVGSALSEPERVAGYFRLNRTYAGAFMHTSDHVSIRGRQAAMVYWLPDGSRSFCQRLLACPFHWGY